MEKELLKFIRENNLSPFNKSKTSVKSDSESLHKTKDAKAIHNKLLSTLSSNFYFSDTPNLFNFFSSFPGLKEKEERQNFFKNLKQQGLIKILTKKPIRPDRKEVLNNRRSRSAKLRAAEKI